MKIVKWCGKKMCNVCFVNELYLSLRKRMVQFEWQWEQQKKKQHELA